MAATITAVVVGLAAASTSAVDGYASGRLACSLSDARITESSGVASASWADDVIWTHNDSGDQPRFFAVNTGTCAVAAVYDVTGARAVDWEDMARAGTTLFLGDIGDNKTQRTSVTVYDVPEPVQGAPAGPVRPSATRTLTYPDGAHDAESLFVDPTTGRLAIVTKMASGEPAAYLAPINGGGVMEKAAAVPVPSATGADATADRIIVRDYLSAYEWEVHPGDMLAAALDRSPTPVGLPTTPQGEAIAYARDGSGLWTTSERQGSPVSFLAREAPPPSSAPGSAQAERPTTSGGDAPAEPGESFGDVAPGAVVAIAASAALIVGLVARHRCRRRRP
jgi:hypothetical protein